MLAGGGRRASPDKLPYAGNRVPKAPGGGSRSVPQDVGVREVAAE